VVAVGESSGRVVIVKVDELVPDVGSEVTDEEARGGYAATQYS
jgi:hypothetical protein